VTGRWQLAWPRGIAARIALTMVLAVAAAQVISIAVYSLTRPPPQPMVSAVWIAERVRDATDAALAAPPEQRMAALAPYNDLWFNFEWRRAAPPEPDPPGHSTGAARSDRSAPPGPRNAGPGDPNSLGQAVPRPAPLGGPFTLVRDLVIETLGERARWVTLRRLERSFAWKILGPQRPGPPIPPPGLEPWPEVRALSPQVFDRMPAPAIFRLDIELDDGSWLIVHPTGEGSEQQQIIELVAMIVLLGAAIAGLAIWSARRLTVPLARLAAAAQHLGRDLGGAQLPEAGPSETRVIAQALNDMRARLQRFIGDRTQMVAAMSHDLRTPLTRLRLLAETLEDGETHRRMLVEIEAMQTMIAETLDFAAQDARREPRQRVDLAALLTSVCDDASDAGRPASYDGPERLVQSCQPVAMRRALTNIVDNAVTYGDRAEVSLAAGPDHLVIAVSDEGPGIAEAFRELVFRPFFRIEESRNRATGGVGLGLAVARSVVRAHGGDVTLAPRTPKGLVVTVTLPREQAA
jgi:signal transduction histidine kinase